MGFFGLEWMAEVRELSPLQYAVFPRLIAIDNCPIRPNRLVGIMGKGVISGLFVLIIITAAIRRGGFWLFLGGAGSRPTYVRFFFACFGFVFFGAWELLELFQQLTGLLMGTALLLLLPPLDRLGFFYVWTFFFFVDDLVCGWQKFMITVDGVPFGFLLLLLPLQLVFFLSSSSC